MPQFGRGISILRNTLLSMLDSTYLLRKSYADGHYMISFYSVFATKQFEALRLASLQDYLYYCVLLAIAVGLLNNTIILNNKNIIVYRLINDPLATMLEARPRIMRPITANCSV